MGEWLDIESAPKGMAVFLLYDFPSGARPVEGIYRNGRFWGRDVDGWWALEPNPGMWIDGWIKGWKPIDPPHA